MKINKFALAAFLLWLITAIVFAWFFVRGATTPGSDNRTAVVLAPAERTLVLSEMRTLLAAVQGIVTGLNQKDSQQVAEAARSAGMAAAADVNPALMAKLPLPFKQLGMSVHRDMDALAQAASEGKPAADLQKMLGDTLTKCVACHATWQLAAAQ